MDELFLILLMDLDATIIGLQLALAVMFIIDSISNILTSSRFYSVMKSYSHLTDRGIHAQFWPNSLETNTLFEDVVI